MSCPRWIAAETAGKVRHRRRRLQALPARHRTHRLRPRRVSVARAASSEPVAVSDYVEPPYLLSGEGTEDERTWSRGIYTDPERIWKAFSVPGDPPRPVWGLRQPAQSLPRNRARLSAYLPLAVLLAAAARPDADRPCSPRIATMLSAQFGFQPDVPESSFVTEPFALREHGTVEIAISANLPNSWLRLRSRPHQPRVRHAWNDGRGGQLLLRRRQRRIVDGGQPEAPPAPAAPARRAVLPARGTRRTPNGRAARDIAIHVRRDVPDPVALRRWRSCCCSGSARSLVAPQRGERVASSQRRDAGKRLREELMMRAALSACSA